MNTTTHTLDVHRLGPVTIDVTEHGTGHPFLLLHGGGGPQTVLPWAARLGEVRPAHVFTPVHPGFGGTTRPEGLATIRDLAATYVTLLDGLGLHDVTVVGNSIGGWIAAEMATLASHRISSYVLLDAVGIEVPGHPVANVFSLTPEEVSQLTFADPTTYGIDPAAMAPALRAVMPGNRAALETYAGHAMTDPGLAVRLADTAFPTLVVWGEADRIVDVDYGRAYSATIFGATFEVLRDAGHLPQVEAPDALIDLTWNFADAHATAGPNAAPDSACDRPGCLAQPATVPAGQGN